MWKVVWLIPDSELFKSKDTGQEVSLLVISYGIRADLSLCCDIPHAAIPSTIDRNERLCRQSLGRNGTLKPETNRKKITLYLPGTKTILQTVHVVRGSHEVRLEVWCQ